MDFSKMSGYEFEDFIANLLKQKGFKVTQTDYSNDGGVDLIAEYFKPLFSGKYIVQCKNYTNNLVGQPELRDLYGVVMSEKANKGILITTSDFTTQAKNFAKDKNLELINGSVLNSLIEGVDIKVEEPQLKFYEMPEFDKNTYDFLKKRLKAGKKNEKNYNNLLKFLKEYILYAKIDICKAGLIDEIKNIKEEKRINTNKDYTYSKNTLPYFSKIPYRQPEDEEWICDEEFDLLFIEGNLAKVRDELIKLKDYYFTELPSFLSFFCCGYNIYYGYYDTFFNMDYYSKDPWTKNLPTPSFLLNVYGYQDLENLFKKAYERYYDIEYSQEKLENLEPIIEIIDKNFTTLYSEKELSEIVKIFKLHANYPENHYFDKFDNNLLDAKSCFIQKLRENTNNKFGFRFEFLRKFEPRSIKNITKFTRLAEIISPLLGLPFKLMLYSAYKQIGFDEGCAEMTKFIKIPKTIDDFSFDFIPEITKILCPDFCKDYREYIELEIKSYNEFLNGAFDKVFNPVWHDKYYKKSDEEINFELSIKNFIDCYINELNNEKELLESYLKNNRKNLNKRAIIYIFDFLDSIEYNVDSVAQKKLSIENASNAKEMNNILFFNLENEYREFCFPGFIEMVRCKEGNFIRESLESELDKKLGKITITKPYMIGKYPVTQELYTRIVQGKSLDFKDIYDSNLMNNITWTEAKEFCDLLNKKLKKYLPLSYKFDLPTEAQWEYACKSEATKKYFTGSGEMLEWSNDWYGDYQSQAVSDPTGLETGEKRVLQGGIWDKESNSWKNLLRDSASPETKSANIGFRVALVPVK